MVVVSAFESSEISRIYAYEKDDSGKENWFQNSFLKNLENE